MGGTFDPIHHGHLVAAEEAMSHFDLDEVMFLPAGQPWMKEHQVVAPREDRYLMTVLGTANNPDFSVSPLEIERPGATHTIDTLHEIRSLREEDPELEMFFITGADAVLDLWEWKEPDEILDLAHVIAATRPGYDLTVLQKEIAEHNLPITILDVPALAISSTDIRRRVGEGRPIRYLVPDAVLSYIARSGLYKGRAS
jgi:nicotinate-nucleotide adenylyltransferase